MDNIQVMQERREALVREDLVRSRFISLRKSEDERDVYEVSVSSDRPYDMGWGGVKAEEILSHNKEAADLKRMRDGAPILYNHNRHEYIGVSLGARLKDGECIVKFKFADNERAVQVKRDVDNGILRNVSIGYRIKNEEFKRISEDHYQWIVDKWEMMEASIVTVPADPSVGFGRGECVMTRNAATGHLTPARQEQIKQSKEHDMPEANTPQTPETRTADAPIIGTAAEQLEALRREVQAIKTERAEASEARGKELDAREAEVKRREGIAEVIANAKSLPQETMERLRLEVLADEKGDAATLQGKMAEELKRISEEEPAKIPFRSNLGLSQREVEKYDLARALDALMSMEVDGKARKDVNCAELEYADEARKRKGDAYLPRFVGNGKMRQEIRNSLTVPWDVLATPGIMRGVREALHMGKAGEEAMRRVRAVSTGSASGGSLVDEVHYAGSFIDVLRDVAVTPGLVSMMPGLVGDVEIPRLTNNVTFGMIAEDADGLTNDPVFDSITMTPHTASGGVPITRRLLQQSTPGVQAILLANLAYGNGLNIDKEVLNGDGTGQHLTGYRNVTGINSVSATDFDDGSATYNRYTMQGKWKLESLIEALADDHALKGNLCWLMDPTNWKLLSNLEQFPGTNGKPLISGNPMAGELLGYPYKIKTGDVGSDILFGNWSEIVLGFWEVMELVIDRVTAIQAGRVYLRCFSDFDTCVKHAASLGKLVHA